MKCPNARCGAGNPDNATVCAFCDTPLGAPATGEPDRPCPACGRPVPAQARFCGKCGCPVAPGPAENVDAYLEPRRPPASATPSAAIDEPGIGPTPVTPTGIGPDPVTVATAGDSRSGVARPMFAASVIVVAGIVGGVIAWLYLSPSPPAAPAPAPTPVVAAPTPPVEPAITAPPTAAGPATSEPPPGAQAPTGHPFLPLLEPDRPAATVPEPPHEEDLRARAERARRRAEARAAKEAAEQQAREAALRAAEQTPPPPAGPREACAGETSMFARNSCEARVCQTREWMFHPFCVQRRQLEDQKRGGTFGGGG